MRRAGEGRGGEREREREREAGTTWTVRSGTFL